MHRLALADNRFDYAASATDASLLRLVQRCKEGPGRFSCTGLPPVSCSAFGSAWMVQSRRPDTCERCGALWFSALLVAIAFALLVAALGAYIYLISRISMGWSEPRGLPSPLR